MNKRKRRTCAFLGILIVMCYPVLTPYSNVSAGNAAATGIQEFVSKVSRLKLADLKEAKEYSSFFRQVLKGKTQFKEELYKLFAHFGLGYLFLKEGNFADADAEFEKLNLKIVRLDEHKKKSIWKILDSLNLNWDAELNNIDRMMLIDTGKIRPMIHTYALTAELFENMDTFLSLQVSKGLREGLLQKLDRPDVGKSVSKSDGAYERILSELDTVSKRMWELAPRIIENGTPAQ